MSFMDELKQTLDDRESTTENGAKGWATTGKELLDLNFAVSSLRNVTADQIKQRFAKAYYEDKSLFITWLFFAGDVRGGLGERRLFRLGMEFLAENDIEKARALLNLIPYYTRWDNLVCILDTKLCDDVAVIVAKQLKADLQAQKAGKPISLCAKWLPSVNTSSAETRRLAKLLIGKLGITEKQYRKTLSLLRSYSNVVEVKMSKKQWSEIDYAAVPSRANLIYNDAFLRNDEERRRDYLSKLEKGETKINAGVLFPHDIVHRYINQAAWSRAELKDKDVALEQMWKALPDYVQSNGSTICVADGSGSMTSTVGNTQVSCLDVANALAIYFAERCSGQFKDTYITFSEHPQLVNLSKCESLRDKIKTALAHDEVANTNIEAVFDLILKTAVNANMAQEDMPSNILILSDMEFDQGVNCGSGYGWGWRGKPVGDKLFETFAKKYEAHGYKLPRLVFWNICSRTETIPIKQNELGVALVSGFSPTIVKMVLSNQTDPFLCLLEQLNDERYNLVREALN